VSTPPAVIEAVAVGKAFPGVVALDGVSVAVRPGEVLAIVGENGAGKSTLMKILAGVYQPDSGSLRRGGEPVHFAGPADALEAGVSLIHQELSLAENLTVAENLFLGREWTAGGPLAWLRKGAMRHAGRAMLAKVGLPESLLNARVGGLSPGQKQLVEIARAVGADAKVLIMDEPTSSLTQTETERLYEVIDGLRAAGVSVVYISHRLAEVTRVSDRAVVLRDGKLSGELAKNELTHDALIRHMIGRDLTAYFPRSHRKAGGEVVLRVENLTYEGGPPHPASLTVRAGEVLGMAGLVGAGRTELAEAVFGVRHVTGGSVEVAGVPERFASPADAIRSGVLLAPEDRRLHGLILEASVGANLSLPNLDQVSTASWIDRGAEAALHARMIDRLRVKTPGAAQTVGFLSGGNQQKVVFGKWLARGPRVLILDEPTRGVDVGAKGEIYTLIDELCGQGVAVWVISSDMEELLGLSDRVAVMHEGRVAGELPRDAVTEEAIMKLATGGSLR
jgi:ribose transport system ATP-binding protein